MRLPGRLERHAPARAQGPGVGKVLRKVPSGPSVVNLSRRIYAGSPPEGRTSVQRFRTREGQGGLTAFLQDVGTELAGSCSGFAGVAESNLAGVAGLGPRLIGCQTNASRFYSPHQNNQVQGQSRSSSTNPATTGFRPTY